MAFTARPATGRHHLGPSPAYAGCTDRDLSGMADMMLKLALACDNDVPMSDRRILLTEADSRLTELAERSLWPPHVAAADDAIEQHLDRMAGL